MTKIDAQLKEAILQDKREMTTKQLQEKYNLSRSSIQRIKLPDLEARAEEFSPPPQVKDERQAVNIVEQLVKDVQKPQAVTIPEMILPPRAPPRDETIQRILLNADTFPAHFPFITDKNAFVQSLSEKSAHQLDDLLKMMERTRSVNNLSNQMKQVFFVTARATESLGTRIRLKTQGLTDALLQQQQELDYIFKELAIEYADKFNTATRPEIKLLMTFGMAVLSVDSQNRLREHIKPEEKYADL
jgi:hypothetical protein